MSIKASSCLKSLCTVAGISGVFPQHPTLQAVSSISSSAICICWSPGTWGANDEIFMLVTIHFPLLKASALTLSKCGREFCLLLNACISMRKLRERVYKIRFLVSVTSERIIEDMGRAFPVTQALLPTDDTLACLSGPGSSSCLPGQSLHRYFYILLSIVIWPIFDSIEIELHRTIIAAPR